VASFAGTSLPREISSFLCEGLMHEFRKKTAILWPMPIIKLSKDVLTPDQVYRGGLRVTGLASDRETGGSPARSLLRPRMAMITPPTRSVPFERPFHRMNSAPRAIPAPRAMRK
jgi:hypothetical protein